MKKFVYFSAVVIVLSACSTEPEVESTPATQITESEVVVPNHLLTMEIEGMVCEMGCGGSIRKELKSTGGVTAVEFDFEDERETNIATIKYDAKMVSLEELVQSVSGLLDGQFTVGETSSAKMTTVTTNESHSTSPQESTKTNVTEGFTGTPNLLDLLSELFI